MAISITYPLWCNDILSISKFIENYKPFVKFELISKNHNNILQKLSVKKLPSHFDPLEAAEFGYDLSDLKYILSKRSVPHDVDVLNLENPHEKIKTDFFRRDLSYAIVKNDPIFGVKRLEDHEDSECHLTQIFASCFLNENDLEINQDIHHWLKYITLIPDEEVHILLVVLANKKTIQSDIQFLKAHDMHLSEQVFLNAMDCFIHESMGEQFNSILALSSFQDEYKNLMTGILSSGKSKKE